MPSRILLALPLLLLGCLEAAPVSFELENATGIALSVQDSDVNADQPAWLRIFNAESVVIRHSGAGVCACDCDQGPGCFAECAALIASVEPLPAGGVITFDWDGLERRFTGDCIQKSPVPGETLSVEACAGDQVVDDPQTDGQIVADTSLRCRRVDFARDAGVVRVVLEE